MGHTGYGRWVGQDSLQEQRMLGDMCGRWGGKESSRCVEMIGLRDTSQCLRDMIASDARTLWPFFTIESELGSINLKAGFLYLFVRAFPTPTSSVINLISRSLLSALSPSHNVLYNGYNPHSSVSSTKSPNPLNLTTAYGPSGLPSYQFPPPHSHSLRETKSMVGTAPVDSHWTMVTHHWSQSLSHALWIVNTGSPAIIRELHSKKNLVLQKKWQVTEN